MISAELKGYDYRENLICDPDSPILIQKASRDRYDDGRAYLSAPHSEDALTWNVFRALQLSGAGGLKIVSEFFSTSAVSRILFWGADLEGAGDEQQLLSILVRICDGQLRGPLTEPDVVMFTEKEVVFCECKLNVRRGKSPWGTSHSGSQKRMDLYLRDFPELEEIINWSDVYQLIRQYVYVRKMAEATGLRPIVLPLINAKHRDILMDLYAPLLDLNTVPDVFRPLKCWQEFDSPIRSSKIWLKDKILNKLEVALAASR